MMKSTKAKPQSNQELQSLARKYEKYSNNNNIFNDKNLSDNSKVTQFQKIKAKPEEAFTRKNIAEQSHRQQTQILNQHMPIFTNNMLNNLFDDNSTIRTSKYPSNLVEVPKVNEKYEITSFYGPSQQYIENLRTLQLNNKDDPVMNLNPSFFGTSQAKEIQKIDEFKKVQEQKDLWTSSNKENFIKNYINKSELDHPYSFHHQSLYGQPVNKVEFPSKVNELMKDTKLKFNGFYSKDPLTLENSYKMNENPYILQTDERMFSQNQETPNIFKQENLLYKANEDLFREIEMRQKEREYEQLMKERQRSQEMNEYTDQLNQPEEQKDQQTNQPQVESLAQKKTQNETVQQYSFSPNKQSQFSEAPRIEDQYIEGSQEKQSSRNIFSIKMNSQEDDYLSSPEQEKLQPKGEQYFDLGSPYIDNMPVMDEVCRKDLPPATSDHFQSKSPQKSVRFEDQKYDKRNSSSKKQMSSSHKSENDSEYYDEDEDDEDEDNENIDQDLQDKIERIKQNLQETGNTNQKEESIAKLEQVLKQQRQRLENMSNTYQSQSQFGTQSNNEPINFELSKTSPMRQTQANNNHNLEKAYEDLEKEILDIKNKLQKSLTQSQYDSSQMLDKSKERPSDRNASGRIERRSGNHNGELEEDDYSLSVSDLHNSLYNESRGY